LTGYTVTNRRSTMPQDIINPYEDSESLEIKADGGLPKFGDLWGQSTTTNTLLVQTCALLHLRP